MVVMAMMMSMMVPAMVMAVTSTCPRSAGGDRPEQDKSSAQQFHSSHSVPPFRNGYMHRKKQSRLKFTA
jgi:hypothetical protein